MSDLRVSCVVPVRDGARHLADAVHSVLAQTAPVLEVIVVDDGSTDGSAAIAASFGGAVRVVRQPHLGVSRARNHGIELARGDLIAFLDADDLFLPHKVERQLARFRVDPQLEMVAAHTVNFASEQDPGSTMDANPQPRDPWPRHISTWLVRCSVFDRVGTFDETMPLSQDVDWHLRAQEQGVVIETLPDVLTRRRLHPGNRTRDHRDECRAAVLGSVRRHLDRMARGAVEADP